MLQVVVKEIKFQGEDIQSVLPRFVELVSIVQIACPVLKDVLVN